MNKYSEQKYLDKIKEFELCLKKVCDVEIYSNVYDICFKTNLPAKYHNEIIRHFQRDDYINDNDISKRTCQITGLSNLYGFFYDGKSEECGFIFRMDDYHYLSSLMFIEMVIGIIEWDDKIENKYHKLELRTKKLNKIKSKI